jgi:hypothetical protein
MRPAWHNIAHDRIRFLVTVLGIAYAVFLMVFQGRALRGFLGAASKVVDSTESEIWITRQGNDLCFPVLVERRPVELPHIVPGVVYTRFFNSFKSVYRLSAPSKFRRHSSVLWASPQRILKSNCWHGIQ